MFIHVCVFVQAYACACVKWSLESVSDSVNRLLFNRELCDGACSRKPADSTMGTQIFPTLFKDSLLFSKVWGHLCYWVWDWSQISGTLKEHVIVKQWSSSIFHYIFCQYSSNHISRSCQSQSHQLCICKYNSLLNCPVTNVNTININAKCPRYHCYTERCHALSVC